METTEETMETMGNRRGNNGRNYLHDGGNDINDWGPDGDSVETTAT